MQMKSLPQYALIGVLGFAAPIAGAAENPPDAPTVVAAIEGAFGVTPGERRNHIKGDCAVVGRAGAGRVVDRTGGGGIRAPAGLSRLGSDGLAISRQRVECGTVCV